MRADPGTAALIDYERLHPLVHFGAGPGADRDAAPFGLTSDGLRYTAAAPVRFFTTNDPHYELAETLELVVERTDGVPATVRLGAGGASRLPILLFDNDYAEADITSVDPGDGTLTVTWEYARESGPFVQRTELQWRRSGQTDWPADGTGLFATGTTAEISGLDNGVEYELRARPIVPDGRSRWPYDDFRLGTGTPRSNVTAPSVGVSAGTAEVTEGTALRFTVRTGAPVSADLGVAVVVAEDGNIDTGNDGTADESSGVLPAAQEGRRSVTIPAGAAEAVLSVLTAADEAWENHATVTVTVSPSDNSAYVVDASASSASTRVRDDDVPGGEVSLSVSSVPGSFSEGGSGSDVVVAEGDGALFVMARFVTDRAEEPHGVFGVRLMTYPVTAEADDDYTSIAQVVHFGSGAGAPADAVPFGLSADGLRYEATAIRGLAIIDDPTIEVSETFDVAVERVPGLPPEIRLGAGDASRARVTVISDDVGLVSDLRVAPGDRTLVVSWGFFDDLDDDAEADGLSVDNYGVRWRPVGDEYPSGRGPFGPEIEVATTTLTIVGLDNGTQYEVEVRPIPARDDEVGSYFRSVSETGRPDSNFQIAEDRSPLFVRGGGVVERVVRLVYDDGGEENSGSLNRRQARPFASRSMAARILTGPSMAQTVQCRPLVPPPPNVLRASIVATGDAPRGQCVTDDEGRLTLVYTSVSASSDSVGNTDHVRLHVDPNENQQRDRGESSVDLDPAVAIVRPINYAALGDSYSAGENGEFTDARPTDDHFMGRYLDAACRRWTMAYPFLAARSPNYASLGFYACSGAVTSDVYVPAGIGNFNGQSSSLDALNSGLGLGSQQRVDMVTITIGGNDVGFADAINACFDPRGCDSGSLKISIEQFKLELGKVVSGLKAAAPRATMFVLGYPQLVPVPSIESCLDLSLNSVVTAINDGYPNTGFSVGNSLERTILNNYGVGRALGISDDERQFLRDAAVDVNAATSDVAAAKGVHYVDVADEFVGHEPCGEEDAWLNGVVAERVDASVVDSPNRIPSSDRSFHPNAVGHREYARILRAYIVDALRGSDGVNRAGLPNNPPAVAAQRGDAGSRGGAATARAAGESPERAASPDGPAPDASAGSATGFLWSRRVASAASACAVPLAPGDRVELFAAGFAPDSAVSFSVVGASVPAVGATSVVELSPAPTIPAATADAAGRLEVTWTIPDAPEALVDPAPRLYVVEASGTDSSAAVLAARSVAPLVVYPGVAPCAVDDTAQTSLGRPVRVAVLANDIAPASGSLEAASVTVDAVGGGAFAVDVSDGSLTFTPDPGFAGTVTTRYWVYDGWDIGVSAAVTVTVDAGCTITGATGATVIEGTDGDDVICVPDPEDWDAFHVIDAKAGDDVIVGGDGVDWIYGGAGQDVVYGRDGADRIDGGTGADTIYGGRDFDTIHSADLADTIHDDADGYELLLTPPAPPAHAAPVARADAAYVAVGQTVDIAVLDNDHDINENLVAASLSITTAPTLGDAHVVVSTAGGVVVRYIAGTVDGVDSFTYQVCDTLNACSTAQVTVTVGTTHCTIVGTDGDDTLRGTPGPDIICGLGGDDVISGLGGDDVISGLGGDDVIIGGAGDDTLYGGDETRTGVNDGDDSLFGGPGDDTLAGGNGNDTLWGGPGDDTLEGNGRDDTLVGGPGDDSLNGGGDNDTLFGGAGDDTLVGHGDNDTLHGGTGVDTLTGGNGDDVLYGDAGDDSLNGGAGGDTLSGGPGDDRLRGNTQNDTLRGGLGADRLHGGGHEDHLVGGAENDILYGDAGDDRLWGNSGDDYLHGGNGTDYTNGGDNTDTCRRGETTARCEA